MKISCNFFLLPGIAICVWTLVMDPRSGIYLEVVYFDSFLNFGQGLFAFGLFGLEVVPVFSEVKSKFWNWWYGEDALNLPPLGELEAETKTICRQFLRHHVEECMKSIAKDVKYRLTMHP